ncbi:hypothetical protein SS50377_26030 [Spironucleus salmonicida]|uniref:Uncharacterized protein n=1 Tax=Spironucleus salmonicida TaxID=348837 RepID=A0A9P8RWE6_9EUKA|nr:hypothetical protein SS50377_26030 [Spironucleus salmonicida]
MERWLLQGVESGGKDSFRLYILLQLMNTITPRMMPRTRIKQQTVRVAISGSIFQK